LNTIKTLKYIVIILGFIIIQACAGNPHEDSVLDRIRENQITRMDVNLLVDGTEIQSAGLELMSSPIGMLELSLEDNLNDSVLAIAVHGYQSQGYEWITGLKNLAEHFGSVFFFRYDWEQCPDLIAADLATQILALKKASAYEKIILFGHSYGGLVVTFAASELDNLNAEINVIAAPLSGYPELFDDCATLTYDENDKLIYPKWEQSVRVIQHKTVHAQDGAFRELASDPQEIDLPFERIQELPPTMDGHRLGHNWSVSWVLDQYIGKPHRY